uniref:Transposase n=1 Tax=Panagrolaimus sp. JU765 TaxID=591449 RepID=A0AC34QVM7_9BILA
MSQNEERTSNDTQETAEQKKTQLNDKKRMLEQEERALRSILLQLRSQQRNLIIEGEKLKSIWAYRSKKASGEIEADDNSNQDSTDLSIP